jgi:translation initiation factor IF-3
MIKKDLRKVRKHKINNEVRFPQVRVIGDGEPQLMSSFEAAKLAQSMGLDLVLINENQTPPIVKIIDYNKFLYDQEKAEKEKKKNAHTSELKEIQLSLNIAEHDMQTKAKHAHKFLDHGDKVKVVLMLKGREKAKPEAGEIVMLNFLQSIIEHGDAESLPKYEGNKWIVFARPKKKK